VKVFQFLEEALVIIIIKEVIEFRRNQDTTTEAWLGVGISDAETRSRLEVRPRVGHDFAFSEYAASNDSAQVSSAKALNGGEIARRTGLR